MEQKHYLEHSLISLNDEIWKDIKGYEGKYQVSNLGRVKSLARQYKLNNYSSFILHERIKKFAFNHSGYLMVILCKNSKDKNIVVHRLVASAFIDNDKNLREVNHKNGIKWDNRVENLEWISSSDNQKHAFRTGLQKPSVGEKHGRAKLKEFQVLEILAQNKKGISNASLAKEYGVSQGTISSIVVGKNWKYLKAV